MSSEPKPCPFCGWGTIVDEAFWLPNKHICKCNACGARTKLYPTWDDAVKAWNRRAEQTKPQTDIHDLTDCDFCKDRNCKDCEGGKDEPQTEEWYTYQDEQEYNDRWQTDCAWK